MLRRDYIPFNQQQPQTERLVHQQEARGSPAVPEGESFSKGRSGPVSSGRGWGGTGGVACLTRMSGGLVRVS